MPASPSVLRSDPENFTIMNNKNEGFTAPCPDGNPNYAAFSRNGIVKIGGYFAAANIGVCDSQYGVPEGTAISYELYDDTIIFSIPGRVRTGLRLFKQVMSSGGAPDE
ncbi:hypothetical protein R1flu_008852 [Riccia fluitans]|uniref:Uncharacterized protein n=1 Tax=Riccia fluitans TaxID=41844 RepID=A0ABD1Z0D8_9MARC